VAFALVAIVLVGGSGQRHAKPLAVSATTASPSASNSSSSTSSSSSSSTSSTSTTTTNPGDTGAVGFAPACVPQAATSSIPITAPDDPQLSTFGPLGAAPTWSVGLPRFRSQPGEVPGVTAGWGVRIPGGFLVSVVASDPSSLSVLYGQSILAAVNDDGSIRWRQCRSDGFGGFTVVSRRSGVAPTQAVISVAPPPQASATVPLDYRIIDLADGHDEGSVHDRAVAKGLDPAYLADQLRGGGGHVLLFAGASLTDLTTDRLIDARDRIVELDLDTMNVAVLRVPRAAYGLHSSSPWLTLTPLDEPAIIDGTYEASRQRAKAIYEGGHWLGQGAAGEGPWTANFPIRAYFDYNLVEPSLVASDATGTIVWARPDLVGTGGEAMGAFSSHGTTIADVCVTGSPASGCPTYALVGVDTATGVERWRADGFHQIAFVADGMAMVQPQSATGVPEQWELIDIATGQLMAADQHWSDPKAFPTDPGGCCLPIWRTAPDGGFVFAAKEDVLSVWMPKALTKATITISLT
jgi:hypothetical protein